MKTEEQFSKFIRDGIEPLQETEGLSRDLWPRMRGRLDDRRIRFSWFDWVLAGLAALLCLIVPESIPGLFYNL